MKPDNLMPAQWQDALCIASSVCDPIRTAGGTPNDALRAFGIPDAELASDEWHKAHNIIAAAAYSNKSKH